MVLCMFGTSANAVKLFEIRLENNVAVLRGGEEDASSQLIKGTVVLCLSEPLSAKNIDLEFKGESRVAWPDPRRARPIQDQSVFFLKNFTFRGAGKGKAGILEMGNYEFPFEVLLPGDMPETVEGLYDCWVEYKLKATITRGRLAHSLHARKNLRVVRTLAPNSLELSHAMSVENIWPDKLEYAINIPCKAVIFGTCIKMDLMLIPILKGLRIGQINVYLYEAQEFILYNDVHLITRKVAYAEYNVSDGLQTLSEHQDGFHLQERLTLPRTLKRCVQDVHCKGMKVRHKLVFSVQLHNPDGHLSELRASLPVYIFISPHLPIGEDGDIVNGNPNDPRTLEALDQHAPPLYGDHEFDALWDHLDPSGYVRAASNAGSSSSWDRDQNQPPEGIYSRDSTASSTSGSRETRDRLHDLPDLSPVIFPSNAHPENSPPPSRVNGTGIRETLDTNDSPDRAPGIPERDNNPPHGIPLSGADSAETPFSRTPEHVEMDANELSRVPSYTAAIKCTARTPLHNDLPTYFSATGTTLSSPMEASQLPCQAQVGRERPRSVEPSRPPTLLDRTSHRHTLLNPAITDNGPREAAMQPPSISLDRSTHRSTFVHPAGQVR